MGSRLSYPIQLLLDMSFQIWRFMPLGKTQSDEAHLWTLTGGGAPYLAKLVYKSNNNCNR